MIATGLPINEPSSRSREAQSMAFFNAAEVPQLYSGVANITASALRTAGEILNQLEKGLVTYTTLLR